MRQVTRMPGGSFLDKATGQYIPADEDNRHYEALMSDVAAGSAVLVDPVPEADQQPRKSKVDKLIDHLVDKGVLDRKDADKLTD